MYVKPEDGIPLSKEDKIYRIHVTGVFLFLARAVNGTLIEPLSSLASEQVNPIKETMGKCKQFVDYVVS